MLFDGLKRRLRLLVLPSPNPAVPIDDFRCSIILPIGPLASTAGRSRYFRLVGAAAGTGAAFGRLDVATCLLIGREDWTVSALSGMGSCGTGSLGRFLKRPISVKALDGARNRMSSFSSGSSVFPRRLRTNIELRRPAIVA